MNARSTICLLSVLIVLSSTSVFAQSSQPAAASQPAGAKAEDLSASVPELMAFHDVIYALWHNAWPDHDAAMMRELLPRVRTDFAAVRNAKLPGILRDKEEAWEAGLGRMAEAITAYEKAAAGSEDQPLFDAVEALHSRFEEQARLVRPHMKELEAYHVFLYQVYHHYVPDRNLEPLRVAADSLQARCAILGEATPPKWFQGDPAELAASIRTLCERTDAFRAEVGTTDWDAITKALEAMHGGYQAIETLFDR